MQEHVKFWKVDAAIVRVFKWISYSSAACLFFMAILATANVIYSKIFSNTIPSSTDWITYMMIPVVYLAIGYMVLDRGLITVDFLEKHYSQWLKNVILVVFYIIGVVVDLLVAVRVFNQMKLYFQTNKISSTSALHFPLWPFYLILSLGMFIFAAAMCWTVVRVFITGNVKGSDVQKPAQEVKGEGR